MGTSPKIVHKATPSPGKSRRIRPHLARPRAKKPRPTRSFASEIVPLTVKGRKMERQITHDELPLKATPDKIPHLKPAFREGGTVTAANSKRHLGRAAALVLMRRSESDRAASSRWPLSVAHASYANQPALFPTAPIGAIRGLAERTGWSLADVDFIRNQRGLAVVAMAAMRDLGLPHEKVNVHGGACALGPSHRSVRCAHSRYAARRA